MENRKQLAIDIIREGESTDFRYDGKFSKILKGIRAGNDEALKNYLSDIRLNEIAYRSSPDHDVIAEGFERTEFVNMMDNLDDKDILGWEEKYMAVIKELGAGYSTISDATHSMSTAIANTMENRKQLAIEILKDGRDESTDFLYDGKVSKILKGIRAGNNEALKNYLSDIRLDEIASRSLPADRQLVEDFERNEFVDMMDGLDDKGIIDWEGKYMAELMDMAARINGESTEYNAASTAITHSLSNAFANTMTGAINTAIAASSTGLMSSLLAPSTAAISNTPVATAAAPESFDLATWLKIGSGLLFSVALITALAVRRSDLNVRIKGYKDNLVNTLYGKSAATVKKANDPDPESVQLLSISIKK
jgi:hypothetical protein